MIRDPKLSKTIQSDSRRKLRRICRQPEYKGEWAWRPVVAIDPFFSSSKRCTGCGYTMPKTALNVRAWICPECGANHDRDINAAKNIKAAGLTLSAHGMTVNLKAV